MQQFIKYSVIAMSLGLITACGGGGGGGGSQASQNETRLTPTGSTPSINYVRDDLKASVREAKMVRIFDSRENVLKTISLADYSKGAFRESVANKTDSETLYVNMLNQAYSAATYIATSKSNELAAHIIGIPTERDNLPKGKATYQGSSLGVNISGQLTFEADFDAKAVSGTIHNRKHDNGTALPDIAMQRGHFYTGLFRNNNTGEFVSALRFQGSARTDNAYDYYEGAFIGPNAEEVVGVILENYQSDPYEIFAGEKQ